MQEMTASRARSLFPSLHDAALLHEPTLITRRRSPNAVLLSGDDLRAILSSYSFSTEVFREGDSVSVWLNELALWGRGSSFPEAKTDLLDELDQLFALLDADPRFRSSPDIEKRLPWIYRLRLARDDEERLAMLFAAPAPTVPAGR
jgi:hypothetical protein